MQVNKKISREKFLRICGSVLAGGSIVAVSTLLIRRMYAAKQHPKILCNSRFPDCSGCLLDCPARR